MQNSTKNRLNNVRKHNGLSVRGFSKPNNPRLKFRDAPITNGLSLTPKN